MAESGNTARDHFIRQRRNLVLMSLFVIFYRIGELEIDQINFLGNETTIGNPAVVTFSLGVFFTYFLWRYYTACREVAGVTNFFKVIQDKAYLIDYGHARKVVKKLDNLRTGPSHKGPKQLRNSFIYEISEKDVNGINHHVRGEFTTSLSHSVESYIRGFFFAICNTSAFSEYVLPYLLGMLAIMEFLGIGIIRLIL